MLSNLLKDYARFVDFRPTQEQQEDYRSRYRFASAEQSRFYFDGFGTNAIDFLFNQRRGGCVRLKTLFIASALLFITTGLASAQQCYESSILSPSPFMGNNGEIFKSG